MPELQTTPGYRWGVLTVIMLGTFMAVLDMSIVNVALPHMMSAFGVNRDQIEWVATGFMLASATVMPFMGWVARRINYKTLYLGCLALFTVASGLCALAWNLDSLIAFRILQALGGGAIQPIGMAIIAELFEPHERGKALGIWGMGVVVAPALGPTLGGYLTDAFSWRTIFSVNIPVGIVTLLIGMVLMRPLYAHGPRRSFDAVGYTFLAMTLIAGLIALSNGQQEGWDSNYIHICEAFTVVGAVMFVAVELAVDHPLMDLRLFINRNYALAVILAVFRSIGLFGGVFLLPIYLQNLMGYTTIQSGFWLVPGAVAVGVTMPIGGRLADRYSPRLLVTIGITMIGISLIMFGWLDPLSGWAMLVFPQVMRGAGIALMMSPLLAAAMNAVPRSELPMASSFLNVAQNVGGAIGIAVLNTFVTNSIHRHAVGFGQVFAPQSEAFHRFAMHVSGLVVWHTPGILATPQVKAGFAAAEAIGHRAQVLGFDNGFVFAGIILLSGIFLTLMLEPSAHHGRELSKAALVAE